MSALDKIRAEQRDEKREDLDRAIVYPTKTKLSGASRNNHRRVATQMQCDGDSSSHRNAAVAAHGSVKERE